MKNYFDLSGRVAVVTGASTGLGLQMAKAFASQGANLVLLARRMNLLEENAKAINAEFGVEVLPFACDITDTEKVKAAVAATIEKFGRGNHRRSVQARDADRPLRNLRLRT